MIVTWFNEEETVFVVKPTTLFSKIRASVAKKNGVEAGSFRMIYDGKTCADPNSPKMMEMMPGRSYNLEVQQEQVGGSPVRFLVAMGM